MQNIELIPIQEYIMKVAHNPNNKVYNDFVPYFAGINRFISHVIELPDDTNSNHAFSDNDLMRSLISNINHPATISVLSRYRNHEYRMEQSACRYNKDDFKKLKRYKTFRDKFFDREIKINSMVMDDFSFVSKNLFIDRGHGLRGSLPELIFMNLQYTLPDDTVKFTPIFRFHNYDPQWEIYELEEFIEVVCTGNNYRCSYVAGYNQNVVESIKSITHETQYVVSESKYLDGQWQNQSYNTYTVHNSLEDAWEHTRKVGYKTLELEGAKDFKFIDAPWNFSQTYSFMDYVERTKMYHMKFEDRHVEFRSIIPQTSHVIKTPNNMLVEEVLQNNELMEELIHKAESVDISSVGIYTYWQENGEPKVKVFQQTVEYFKSLGNFDTIYDKYMHDLSYLGDNIRCPDTVFIFTDHTAHNNTVKQLRPDGIKIVLSKNNKVEKFPLAEYIAPNWYILTPQEFIYTVFNTGYRNEILSVLSGRGKKRTIDRINKVIFELDSDTKYILISKIDRQWNVGDVTSPYSNVRKIYDYIVSKEKQYLAKDAEIIGLENTPWEESTANEKTK